MHITIIPKQKFGNIIKWRHLCKMCNAFDKENTYEVTTKDSQAENIFTPNKDEDYYMIVNNFLELIFDIKLFFANKNKIIERKSYV